MQSLRHHIIVGLAAVLLVGFPLSAMAAPADGPDDPSCLGSDVSGVAQALGRLGFFVVRDEAPMDDNVLNHLNGIPTEPTTCPPGEFPTPLP